MITLHKLLDWGSGSDDAATLRQLLAQGADPEARSGPNGETALHVAVRRYRPWAATILLDHGADIDAQTAFGKTAYAHAIRRGFGDLATLLIERQASTELNTADRLAIALGGGDLDAAQAMLAQDPRLANTGNPEEDRLLADLAGRGPSEPVAILIAAGADLSTAGLDSGTPLHQAAWFGQPANISQLIDAGAPLEIFDSVHESSPLGWAVHGSRYSGDAEERQDVYIAGVRLLLAAGASLSYPDQPESDAYLIRLREDATPRVKKLLP